MASSSPGRSVKSTPSTAFARTSWLEVWNRTDRSLACTAIASAPGASVLLTAFTLLVSDGRALSVDLDELALELGEAGRLRVPVEALERAERVAFAAQELAVDELL